MRQLIQLSTYDSVHSDPTLGKIIDYIPEAPKAELDVAMSDHQDHPSYKLIIDKFSQKVGSEEMKTFLAENEILRTYYGDINLFFIKCLFFHAR